MKRMLYVYNPKAGKGRLEAELFNILAVFRNAGYAVLTHATTAKGEGYEFVRDYLKKCTSAASGSGEEGHIHGLPDRIVSGGGDGTLQEIVRAVKDSWLDIPIGIIPSGSTNDFGYSLGIEKDILKAAKIASTSVEYNETVEDIINGSHAKNKSEKACTGSEFKCDIATINGKYFVYTAAFGLFSEVSYATPQKLKNLLGHFAYILYGTATLLQNRKIHAQIEYINQDMEAEFLDEELLLGMVVSAKSVGGFRGITGRNVLLDDGMDELMLVRWPKNPLQLLGAVFEALTHKENGKYFKVLKAYDIIFRFDRKIKWSVDGEYGGKGKYVEIDVERRGITYVKKRGRRDG